MAGQADLTVASQPNLKQLLGCQNRPPLAKPLRSPPSFVVRNGVDFRERFQSVPLTTAGQVHIVGVGSLFPVKRWDRLLVAALELKRRGLDCLVRIAGDGPLRRSLEQQAQDLGLATRIEFMGHIDDIPSVLSGATFL